MVMDKAWQVQEWAARIVEMLDALNLEDDTPDTLDLFEGVFDLDVGAVPAIEYWLQAKRLKAASEILRKLLEANAVETMGGARADAVVYGPYRIRPYLEKQRKVADTVGLTEWLGDDYARAVPLRCVSITVVRGLAVERGENPAAVEDTFFTVAETGRLKMGMMPVVEGKQ